MILSKPKSLVRLAKLSSSTTTTPSASFKIKAPTKEEVEYARKYELVPPAFYHPLNPHYHPHVPSAKWKYVAYVMVPLLLGVGVNAFLRAKEEEEHLHEHRPEYVPVEYMRITRTPFPWGDGKLSLFHNPKRNPVPGVGYEE